MNIDCPSGTYLALQAMCDSLSNCNGISFSSGAIESADTSGWGCLKQHCSNDGYNGFGSGSHGYYEKKATCDPPSPPPLPLAPIPSPSPPPPPSCWTVKYANKWPHCVNLKHCPGGQTYLPMQALCDAESNCFGFSFSSGAIEDESKTGCGCLKQSCEEDGTNGYGYGSHGYYEKGWDCSARPCLLRRRARRRRRRRRPCRRSARTLSTTTTGPTAPTSSAPRARPSR